MLKTFKPNSICLRCGVGKKEKNFCSAWGKSYSRHLWNKKSLRIEEIKVVKTN